LYEQKVRAAASDSDGLISQTAAKMGPSKPTPASLHTAPVLRSSTDVPARRVCALRHRFSPI
jgi:hypothetical protein